MELVLLLALAAGVWWLVHRRDVRAVPDAGWSVPPAPTVAAPAPDPPVAGTTTRAGSVVGALTRVETRAHVASLPFATAVLLAGMCTLAMAGWVDIFDNGAVLGRVFLHLGGLAYPITGMVLLATNRAALRDRREGTVELTDATPTRPVRRSPAWMLAAWPSAALLAAAIAVVVSLSALGVTESRTAGTWGPGWLPETLLAFALVAGGAALGVALARWVPHPLAAPVALVLLLIATLSINGLRPLTERVRYFAPWTTPPRHLAPEFMSRPSWAHLLYVAGLVAVVALLALAHDRRDRVVAVALTIAVAVTAVGAVAQLRGPSPEDIRATVARVERGGDRCTRSGTIEACTYPGYEDWRARWIEAATKVFGTVPVAPARYVAVQRVGNAGRRSLDPEVRARVEPRGGGYGFGGEMRSDADTLDDIAWWVLPAHAAVGLPRVVGPDGGPCYAGGQARAVVALWAVIVATGDDPDTWRAEIAGTDDGIGDTWDARSAQWATTFWPADWDTDVDAPVVYARSDATLAVALTGRRDTRARLRAEWARWTDPATPTADLAAAMGLAAPRDPRAGREPAGMPPCR